MQLKFQQDQADCLATLGLFAYLGRMTRIFLSSNGIKDLDELVKDFLRCWIDILSGFLTFLPTPWQR